MAAIKLNQLTKTYDNGFQAVKAIDLHIRNQEFMVLVGPSGCGKTTTLRMIAGLEDVTDGDIFIGQKRVNEVEPKDRDIAMVFQNYALYPHMTVFDNMAYGLKLRNVPKAAIHEQVLSVAKLLNLTEQLPKRPKQLSGGQRQRVALGRAIVRKPQVFLFDEPLSNLDAKLRTDMRYELKTLQQRLKTTMVYVTHDQIEAMTLGDRITVMSNGAIQQVDQPTVIYDFPVNRFVASFIGTPAMNFIPGQVQLVSCGENENNKDGDNWEFITHYQQRIALRMPGNKNLATLTNREVVLGIRPELLANAHYMTPAPDAAIINMRVQLIEMMGDHQYIYLDAGDPHALLTMKCDAHHRVTVGATIPIRLSTERAHIFDGTNEFARNITLIN